MKRALIVCPLVAFAVAAIVRAEIVAQSSEELQKSATHVVLGTVRFIGTAETRDRDWIHTGGVVEIKVSDVKKGKRIEPGDCVYARFWRQGWIGKGDPPPFGTGHHLPKKGDRVRVFLKESDGGYDALLPNGIEVLAESAATTPPPAVAPAAAPASAR